MPQGTLKKIENLHGNAIKPMACQKKKTKKQNVLVSGGDFQYDEIPTISDFVKLWGSFHLNVIILESTDFTVSSENLVILVATNTFKLFGFEFCRSCHLHDFLGYPFLTPHY